MQAPAPDHIVARLLLRAVLSALPIYAEREASARRTIEGWRFTVRFASAGGVAATLSFRDGAVAVDESRPALALRLSFLSDRDVVRAFRRRGVPVVLPWGGLHHLAKLPALSGLLADMAEVLNTPVTETPKRAPHRHSREKPAPSESGGGNPRETTSEGGFHPSGSPRATRESDDIHTGNRRELRVALLLGALLPAAVTELGTHDDECRRLLTPFGDFAARWSVPRVADGWITRCGGRMEWGRGNPPVAPDVQVEFRDPEVALSAVDGMLDPLAASVTGEIRVRGMIPLADALARVMERVSECLDQSRS